MKETFFQICIIITITLFVFTLAINFVNAAGFFSPVSLEIGYDIEDDSNATFGGFISGGGLTGMGAVWDAVLTIGGIASVAVAILMHSAVPVGVYIFSAVFWSSYVRSMGIINITGIFEASPMSYFLLIGTGTMLFIWAAAVAGIFTGSG